MFLVLFSISSIIPYQTVYLLNLSLILKIINNLLSAFKTLFNHSVHSRNCINKLIKIISIQIDYNFTYCLAYRFNTKKTVKLNLK